MNNNDQLINAIIDLSQEIKGLRKDMNTRLEELNHRVEKLEKQQAKTNLALGEMRLSYMRVAERLDVTNSEISGLRSDFNGLRSDFNKYASANDTKVNGHEKRIVRLEDAISGNGEKGVLLAKEPQAEYKKKRKQHRCD